MTKSFFGRAVGVFLSFLAGHAIANPCDGPVDELLDSFNSGNYARTVEISTEMMGNSKSPQCAPLFVTRGRAFLLLGQIDDAVHDLEIGVRLNPTNCTTNLFLAIGYRNQGRSDIPDYGLLACIQNEPKNMDARNMLASVYVANEDFHAAADAYRAIAELDPENTEARVFVAYALRKATQYDEARAVLDAILKLSPDSSFAIEESGQLHYTRGNFEESIKLYSRAIELGAANGDSDELIAGYFNSRALAWLELEKGKSAANDVAQSLSIFENAGAYLTRAKLALEDERLQEACRDLDKASSLDPYPNDRAEIDDLKRKCSS